MCACVSIKSHEMSILGVAEKTSECDYCVSFNKKKWVLKTFDYQFVKQNKKLVFNIYHLENSL